MKLELEVKTKEDAEMLIKQLQGFIEKNKLYPDIERSWLKY